MAAPYVTIATWPKIDVAGEAIFDGFRADRIRASGEKGFCPSENRQRARAHRVRIQQREARFAGNDGSAERKVGSK
jgi:hypothetical protein